MSSKDLRIAIVGSGFSGLGMAIRLKRAGIHSFFILERAGEIGGTWRDNSYPGCACDIPAHLYSFSFEQNANWSRLYSPWHEIQAYLERCTDKYQLRSHIKFNSDVREARFDGSSGKWTILCSSGQTYRANILISATGPLNKPVIPDIRGLGSFAGEWFHSSTWNHDYDLTDKNVAVIGTGASAIQIIPGIVDRVKKLYVYQRTPPWVVPRWDRPFGRVARAVFRQVPPLRWIYRALLYWYQEQLAFAFVTNLGTHKLLEKIAAGHMKRVIKNPAMREKLTPSYRIGCKRILVADDYYPAIARDHVELVTEPIKAFTMHGILTEDGMERAVDAIVLATGFAATEFVAPMKIYGKQGTELGALWRRDVESYLGITVSGFPNFFMLIGPNTGLGHNSVVFMLEAQVHYVLKCIEAMRRKDAASIELRDEVQRAFSKRLQERMQRTTWVSGCRSWYLREDGKNFTLWPGFTVDYWLRTRRFREAHYEWA